MKPKITIILGQTATGKSDLAIKIAKRFNGEVISADSRQVYKGLDIGSGKIMEKEMRGVPHHLINVANPKKVFSVAEYKKLAEKAVEKIIRDGKVPIICGGTGFYIDALINDIVLPKVPPNIKLRKVLEKKSTQELFKILKKLDKRRAKNIDKNNPVRLIRAIEIAKALGKVPHLVLGVPSYDILKIGIKLSSEKLKNNIEKRLIKRLNSGMIKEVDNLHKSGLSYKRMRELGLEYKFLANYLNKKISKKEMVEGLYTAICQYSKRQDTWFKRDKDIKWFNPTQKNFIKKTRNLVKKFLNK